MEETIFQTTYKRDYNKLKQFYITSLRSFDKYFTNDVKKKEKQKSYLYEVILVKIISITENYFIELIKACFLLCPEKFYSYAITQEIDMQKILLKDNISQIRNEFLSSIYRKITSGGVNETKKIFNKTLSIDFEKVKGYDKTKIIYDYRHLLVHRLGKTDEQFRKKHSTNVRKITLTSDIIEKSFIDFYEFNEQLSYAVQEVIDCHNVQLPRIKDQYLKYTIKSLDGNIKRYINPDLTFIAEDEVVKLADLIEQYYVEANILHLSISGSDYVVLAFRSIITDLKKKCLIDIIESGSVQNVQKKNVQITQEEIDSVKKLLPEQPWKTGIHKEIAQQLGYSHIKVSTAIKILINNGDFLPQVNGKLFRF
jgi:hypothetical protein